MTPTTFAPPTVAVPSNPLAGREAFIASRSTKWDELTALTVGPSTARTPTEVRRVGALYRAVSGDLALARSLFPNDPLLTRLEGLLAPARIAVYRRPNRRFSLREFYARTYWRRVLERPGLTGVATALLLLPALALFFWALRDPERAATLLGERFSGGRTSWGDQGYSSQQQAAVASEIFVNNIRVSFLAFAAGITLCFGTGWLLIFNGALLGLVAGTSTAQGHGDVAFTLIVAHGVLELSVIIVTAVAGMRMGWAIIEPGRRTRAMALRNEAIAAVEIVLGTIPFFVLAGLIEGFFTPAGFGPVWAGAVGVVVGGAYWLTAFVRSRSR
jgi:uncharacterized membrane protein SpoIIM required for sporulation